MALLAWIKSEKVFLKIQEGTGDGLSQGDLDAGMVDYVVWNVFRPECLDVDEELPMEYLRGGVLTDTEPIAARSALGACLEVAFGGAVGREEVVVLVEDALRGGERGKVKAGAVSTMV